MTFGLGGLFDVASTDAFGNMTEVEEDFGQTLAVWGVPDGPYVMLPIFGPSSVRDAFGLGVDTITNPLSFGYRMNGIGLEARLSGPVVRGVSTREKYLDYIDEMKEVLLRAGRYANQIGQRLTSHPGQFNVLCSPSEHVVSNPPLVL